MVWLEPFAIISIVGKSFVKLKTLAFACLMGDSNACTSAAYIFKVIDFKRVFCYNISIWDL